MKAKLLFLLFIFFVTASFGQTYDWGNWTSIGVDGIQFKVKGPKIEKSNDNRARWYIEFRSTNGKGYTFSYTVDNEEGFIGGSAFPNYNWTGEFTVSHHNTFLNIKFSSLNEVSRNKVNTANVKYDTNGNAWYPLMSYNQQDNTSNNTNNSSTTSYTQQQTQYQQQQQQAIQQQKQQQKQQAINDLTKLGTDLVTDIASAIQQAKEQKKEQEEQKRIEKEKEYDRKEALIKADKSINTLNDSKIFGAYSDYVVKNLEALGFTFEKLTFFNRPDEKFAFLEFKKGLKVHITNKWWGGTSGMYKDITFKAENVTIYSKVANSTFFNNLRALNPFYDEKNRVSESFDYTNFKLIGIEKTEPFIDIYNKGYKSATYKGFAAIVKDLEVEANTKLAQTDNSVQGLWEKAGLYKYGDGVEKNYQKALEFYQQAYEKSNDKQFLLSIGHLYREGDNYLPKNLNKAIEYYENCLNDSNLESDLKAVAHSCLAWIYRDTKSQLYNVEKAKYNHEKEISFLEEEYNTQSDLQQKSKLKKRIANTYSSLGLLYNSYGKKTLYLK